MKLIKLINLSQQSHFQSDTIARTLLLYISALRCSIMRVKI